MASDPAQALDRGFLKDLFAGPGEPKPDGKEPILQVLHLSQMVQDPARWKIALSDGEHAVQGMLAAQCSPLAEQKTLQQGAIIRLRKFTANNLKGKRIIIVLSMDVLQEYGIVPKIGSPVTLVSKPEGHEQAAQQQPTSMSGKGFYGSNVKQETSAQRQPLPSRLNSTNHGNIYTIEMLSPYQPKWTIKARVTSKSPIKTWQNDRGKGKLFSINLLDETGEIRATAFNDQCDAYYEMIEEGSVYYISAPCTVKLAQKQFNTLNNDYELTFERETAVEKAEEQQDVPKIRYNFTSIADVGQVEKDAVIDTIGILREIGDASQITSGKTGKSFYKRELTLVDRTNFEIQLTVWGNTAQEFTIPIDSVVAFKGAKVSDFGGRSLSLLSSGTMAANPDIDEAFSLKAWYDAQGRNETFADHRSSRPAGAGLNRNGPLKTIEQVKQEHIGNEEQERFSVKATTVIFRQKKFAYPACPSPPEAKCNKQMVDMTDGTWRCEKCELTAAEPQWRYILNLSISDHTDQCRVTCFDEVAKKIVGMEAKEMMDVRENGEAAEQQAWLNVSWRTFIFNCRASMETYQDRESVRYTVMDAYPVDFISESKKLADIINSYG